MRSRTPARVRSSRRSFTAERLAASYLREGPRSARRRRARTIARCTTAAFTPTSRPAATATASRSLARRFLRRSNRTRACVAASRRSSRVGRPSAGRMLMQSTGHGAMQSSQPVHARAITVCINFDAPTIASTGQASMHSVHPIQIDSSTIATAGACAAVRLKRAPVPGRCTGGSHRRRVRDASGVPHASAGPHAARHRRRARGAIPGRRFVARTAVSPA